MAATETESRDAGTLRDHADRFHRVLTELIRVYQFRDRDAICCHGVSVTQCHALAAMAETEGLTLNELAAELYLEKSTVSRIVKKLEEKGLVDRSRHPEDGRAVQLTLTPEGGQLHDAIHRDLLEEQRRLLADFDPGVRESMIQFMDRLKREAASRIDTTGGQCCRID